MQKPVISPRLVKSFQDTLVSRANEQGQIPALFVRSWSELMRRHQCGPSSRFFSSLVSEMTDDDLIPVEVLRLPLEDMLTFSETNYHPPATASPGWRQWLSGHPAYHWLIEPLALMLRRPHRTVRSLLPARRAQIDT